MSRQNETFISDAELLSLFQKEPQRAWDIFIDRHADTIFKTLQRSGYDYDQAMERFVYVCEKLCEQNFRRLKTIQHTGNQGELTPWLYQVVKRLSINWAWSQEGRDRLFKPITTLTQREQKIFELHFRRGFLPTEIHEQLLLEHENNLEIADVFEALEKIFAHLSENKLWRLLSQLNRARQTLSFDAVDEETGFKLEPIDEHDNPEDFLIRQEENARFEKALEGLSVKEKLVIEFRYEETMSAKEIADILKLEEREVKNLLKSSFYKIRKILFQK
jgi:DNA-directed RNA polymerase specialized sigma24 family protein